MDPSCSPYACACEAGTAVQHNDVARKRRGRSGPSPRYRNAREDEEQEEAAAAAAAAAPAAPAAPGTQKASSSSSSPMKEQQEEEAGAGGGHGTGDRKQKHTTDRQPASQPDGRTVRRSVSQSEMHSSVRGMST